MHAIAFAARKGADLALLIAALEVEPRHVRARRDLPLAELDFVVAAGDLVPDALVGSERVARLIDIRDLDGLAEPEGPAVGLLLSRNHPEERRLAGAVGPDDADDTTARQREGDVVHQQEIPITLPKATRFDDDVAETRT